MSNGLPATADDLLWTCRRSAQLQNSGMEPGAAVEYALNELIVEHGITRARLVAAVISGLAPATDVGRAADDCVTA